METTKKLHSDFPVADRNRDRIQTGAPEIPSEPFNLLKIKFHISETVV